MQNRNVQDLRLVSKQKMSTSASEDWWNSSLEEELWKRSSDWYCTVARLIRNIRRLGDEFDGTTSKTQKWSIQPRHLWPENPKQSSRTLQTRQSSSWAMLVISEWLYLRNREEGKEGKCQKIPGSYPLPVHLENCHDNSYQESEVKKRHQANLIQISLKEIYFQRKMANIYHIVIYNHISENK